MIRRIQSGGPFEDKIGYCRAVVVDGWVHVSGTVCGLDENGNATTDPAIQTQGALRIIAKALADAGCTFADVVRVTYMLPDGAEFEACWPTLRDTFGANPPAATMIVCGLIAPQFRIEIEGTARQP